MTADETTPLRLYLMQVAALAPMNVPIPCYLVQTSEKNILIDSGLPAHFQTTPGRPEPVMGKNVVEQLALLGLQPGDIDILVCTHFDLDHCGHHEDFPNAQLVVQREHYEVARGGHPRFASHRAHWDLPAERYRLVDGDTTLLPGLELIATGGHVPGHQSVLVRLPETGPVLLTIDAVARQDAFRSDRQIGPLDLDGEQAIASTRKLLDVVQREHVALVIFGHDDQQWPKLTKAPEYYG
ncbi:N-acyl homoserine lactonase family protein [Dictyobacter formicarum]|uniref:N-acyl homoserine lactone hydrolase n=1 Tax=Dictyobacter formicarum TaxID=2778368 RepID=A0ABQ3VFL7_9CHLR|nr:N-acyl homoserine lactonase family protein [Dictyobacter formicarum]GHO84790.1 N-acyl homoserine lactone hydrolase [Dictyobacter formicarum]